MISSRSIAVVVALCVPHWAGGAALPDWLGGPPDLEQRAEWCGVYGWVFEQADAQTEGLARKDELASQRLINLLNKLLAHHRKEGEDSYSAEIRYLVISEESPHHFTFQIMSEKLDALMAHAGGHR